MSSSFHSADVTPDRDKASHLLVVNGAVIARFNDLAKALAVRGQILNEAVNKREQLTKLKV